MKQILDIIQKLEYLVKKDSTKIREEIEIICHIFLNEQFNEYKKLNGEIQDAIDELSVMHQYKNYKEPKIKHMSIKEIKLTLDKLKEATR